MNADNTPDTPRKESLRIVGHAYRPLDNPLSAYNRTVTPACECGAVLLNWPVKNKTAREVHARHKKSIARSARSGIPSD